MARPNARQRQRGTSLPEILTVVAVLGVLTAVAIPQFDRLDLQVSAAVKGEDVERLNQAVSQYNQIAGIFTVAANDSASTDEEAVIALLHTRDPIELPGSPYLESSVDLESSAGAEDEEGRFRAVWNGYVFKLVPPDEAGSGLFLD